MIDGSNSNYNPNELYDKNSYDCWKTWIYLAGLNPKEYKSSDILENNGLLKTLMSNKEAVQYLFNSRTFILPVVMNDRNFKEVVLSKLESIPAMTDSTTPCGEVKESQYNAKEYSGWNVFSGFWSDENIKKYGQNTGYYDGTNKAWLTPNSTTEYPAWVQYKFNNKKITPVIFEYISSYSWGYGCVHKIKIQGSNNETDWKDLTEEIECQPFTKYEIFPTKNIDEYQYYRLNVLSKTETYGNRTDVLKFQVYGY